MTKFRHIKAWRLGAAVLLQVARLPARAFKQAATMCGVMIKRGEGSCSALKGQQPWAVRNPELHAARLERRESAAAATVDIESQPGNPAAAWPFPTNPMYPTPT